METVTGATRSLGKVRSRSSERAVKRRSGSRFFLDFSGFRGNCNVPTWDSEGARGLGRGARRCGFGYIFGSYNSWVRHPKGLGKRSESDLTIRRAGVVCPAGSRGGLSGSNQGFSSLDQDREFTLNLITSLVKCQHPTRLETRTKESNMDVSLGERNSKA